MNSENNINNNKETNSKISKFKKKILSSLSLHNEIHEDKKIEVQVYLKHKQCKNNIIFIANICKYIFLFSSTIIIFIALNSEYEQQKILIISGGVCNLLNIACEKIVSQCDKEIKKIKKKINMILNVYNTDKYDV